MEKEEREMGYGKKAEENMSAWAAITKHRLGGLNNKHLFLMVLEVGKSKIQVPEDLMSGENPLPGLHTTTLLL